MAQARDVKGRFAPGSRNFGPRKGGGVRIIDNTKSLMAQIEKIVEGAIDGFADDVVKMSRALLTDSTGERSEGKLAASIHHQKEGKYGHAVVTDAKNPKGLGYGGMQEYGWHPYGGGEKTKGKFFILRGTYGMMKRWQRGEKWRD